MNVHPLASCSQELGYPEKSGVIVTLLTSYHATGESGFLQNKEMFYFLHLSMLQEKVGFYKTRKCFISYILSCYRRKWVFTKQGNVLFLTSYHATGESVFLQHKEMFYFLQWQFSVNKMNPGCKLRWQANLFGFTRP